MMKKILYILASFLLGFILIMYSITYNTYSALQSFVNEAIEQENYTEAQRFFSSALDNGSKVTLDAEDGTHVEVYYALSEKTNYLLDEEGKPTDTSYYTIESGLQFTLFDLVDTFKLADDEGKNGGINIVFENGENILFPFVTEDVNYYNSATNYSFLLFNISYSDYNKALEANENVDNTSLISGLEIIDGSGEVKYNLEFIDARLSFDNQFHTSLEAVLSEYNKIQKEYAEGKEITEETTNKIKNDYLAIINANENYLLAHESNKIYGSSKFLVGVILTAVIFLAVDILVGWLIFKKKKSGKYIPPYQQNQRTIVKSEPEQFNRAVFDLDADEVVEVVSGMNNNTENENTTNE